MGEQEQELRDAYWSHSLDNRATRDGDIHSTLIVRLCDRLTAVEVERDRLREMLDAERAAVEAYRRAPWLDPFGALRAAVSEGAQSAHERTMPDEDAE